MGWRAIQLDGAAQGLRARELDRSARRDLAALFRRLNLSLSGLDLWIPPAHFRDAANADRAVAAVESGAVLVSELAGLIAQPPAPGRGGRLVCIALPGDCPSGVISHLDRACEAHGVMLADHAWPARAPAGTVGVGVDPASMIFAGADPVAAVSGLASTPIAARLTDLAPTGRVEVGSGAGSLDRIEYEAALHAGGFEDFLVVDLRGLPDPVASAGRQSPRHSAPRT